MFMKLSEISNVDLFKNLVKYSMQNLYLIFYINLQLSYMVRSKRDIFLHFIFLLEQIKKCTINQSINPFLVVFIMFVCQNAIRPLTPKNI